MQVLVLAVQNAVDYARPGRGDVRRDAGARDRRLARGGRVRGDLHHPPDVGAAGGSASGPLPREVAAGGRLSGDQLAQLPASAPLGLRARLRARAQPRVPGGRRRGAARIRAQLAARRSARCARPPRPAPAWRTALAAPRAPDSLAEIERALSRATTSRAASAVPRAAWPSAPASISARGRPGRSCASTSTDSRAPARSPSATASRRTHRRRRRRAAPAWPRRRRGRRPALTTAGHSLAGRAVAARRELLTEALADDSADRDPAVNELLRRLARELTGERP